MAALLAYLYWLDGDTWKSFNPAGINQVPENLATTVAAGIAGYSLHHKLYQVQLVKPGGLEEVIDLPASDSGAYADFRILFNTGAPMDCVWTVRIIEHDTKYFTKTMIGQYDLQVRVGTGGAAPGYGVISSIIAPAEADYGGSYAVGVTIRNQGTQPALVSAHLYLNLEYLPAYKSGQPVEEELVAPGGETTWSFYPEMGPRQQALIASIESNDGTWRRRSDSSYLFTKLQGGAAWNKAIGTRVSANVQLNNNSSVNLTVAPEIFLGGVSVRTFTEREIGAGGGALAWAGPFTSPEFPGKQVVQVNVNRGSDIIVRHFAGLMQLNNIIFACETLEAGLARYPEAAPTHCVPFFTINISNPSTMRANKTLEVRYSIDGEEHDWTTLQRDLVPGGAGQYTYDGLSNGLPVFPFGSQVEIWLEDDDDNRTTIFSGVAE